MCEGGMCEGGGCVKVEMCEGGGCVKVGCVMVRRTCCIGEETCRFGMSNT